MVLDLHNWQSEQPATPGQWFMKCFETDYQVERIPVVLENGVLFAQCPDLGKTDLNCYHNGLTEISWAPDELYVPLAEQES